MTAMTPLRVLNCIFMLFTGVMLNVSNVSGADYLEPEWIEDGVIPASNTRAEFKTRLLLGQVQYYASQKKYFDALSIIDNATEISAQEINRRLLHLQAEGHSVQTIAEIELAYQMSHRAGSAVSAIVGERIEQKERNIAAYELAQSYYDKQQYEYASYALKLIRGELLYPFNRDVRYLQGKIAANTGNYSEAIEIFGELKYEDRYKGFATFNLGYSLLASDQLQDGLEQIALVGDMKTNKPALLALKDKANLLLGYHHLENARPEQAKEYLNKVRLSGAFSNKALLGVAWADMAMGNYRASMAPWTELHSRSSADESVLESYLALPYVYGKFSSYGQAIKLYERAIAEYDSAVEKILNFSDSVEDGTFLHLASQRKYQSDMSWLLSIKAAQDAAPDSGGTPATYYLMELIASKEFQQAVTNYIELDELVIKMQHWRRVVTSLQDLVERRDEERSSKIQRVDATSSEDSVKVSDGEEISEAGRDEPDELLLEPNQQRELMEPGHIKSKDLQGYRLPLHAINKKLDGLVERTGELRELLTRQIGKMVITELDRKITLLSNYLATARYELAKSYDQVAAKQAAQ